MNWKIPKEMILSDPDILRSTKRENVKWNGRDSRQENVIIKYWVSFLAIKFRFQYMDDKKIKSIHRWFDHDFHETNDKK